LGAGDLQGGSTPEAWRQVLPHPGFTWKGRPSPYIACFFGIEPGVPQEDRLRFVNWVNDTAHVLRFSTKAQSPDKLVVDHDLPFQGGVLESQIRFILRFFHQGLPLLIALRGGAGLLR